MKITKPENLEPNAYFTKFINKVEENDLVLALSNSKDDLVASFLKVSEEDSQFAYAKGKWTIKQVVKHLSDTERILSYRALRFGRNDNTPIPGFDEDHYAAYDNSANLKWEDVIEEFALVRMAKIKLFESMDLKFLDHAVMSGETQLCPRDLGFIIVGHALHHAGVIQEKYIKLS